MCMDACSLSECHIVQPVWRADPGSDVILWLAASYWNRSMDHKDHIMRREIRKEMEKGVVVNVANTFMDLYVCPK